jgi:hypothetical protein
MNNALKTYLEKADPVQLDSTLMQEHIRVMTEEVIPAILEDLQEAEQVAAELRYAPATTHRRDRKR